MNAITAARRDLAIHMKKRAQLDARIAAGETEGDLLGIRNAVAAAVEWAEARIILHAEDK
jgi:hypothetical protein